MNVFDSLRSYAGSWVVTNSRKFNAAEKSAIVKNEIKAGQYGLSVCFFMRNGQQKFIPLSNQSTLNVGDSVDIDNCNLLTLERNGETCLRVE